MSGQELNADIQKNGFNPSLTNTFFKFLFYFVPEILKKHDFVSTIHHKSGESYNLCYLI
jgi:hypothetical protein